MHVSEFLQALEAGHASANTVRAYRADLSDFARWFSGTNGYDAGDANITPTDLRDYREWMITRSAKPATVNRRLAALRRYLTWSNEVGLIETPPKVPKGLATAQEAPKSLDKREEHALLRAVERDGNARDRAIFVTLFNTGLRVGEIVGLRAADVTLTARAGLLTVRRSKANRSREIPLNAEARQALRSYLEQRPNVKHDFIFIGRGGHPLGARGVQDLFRHYAHDAHLGRVTPHCARHTILSKLLRRGTDIVTVADIAGHANTQTLMLYARPSAQDKVRALEGIA